MAEIISVNSSASFWASSVDLSIVKAAHQHLNRPMI